ncbi:MAG: hypothetical protein A2428_04330 [Bdellovibrionales bacterium RIFOXYC1_FULL_54_43]|nr:MAG: hypothetical protein A2428_04330 [Bdellovibrionales bacterium RIFOXYC1_FULL_54_43]OFZ83869.1 MAG: hypothetical protein A2603_09075 [Bdellovibrionales bacterium RIFOXYD1_FULL_55_31]
MATFKSESTLRDARNALKEVQPRFEDAVEDVSRMATDLYEDSSKWLRKNYGKTLGGAALIAAAGIIGYFVGRKSKLEL